MWLGTYVMWGALSKAEGILQWNMGLVLTTHRCRSGVHWNKFDGPKFLHSIQVYTRLHRFPSRLTPVKGPPATQWPVTVILDGSLVIFRATTSMKQNAQHIYLLSLLLALKVLQTTNTQQLSSVTKALNHCNCHWVAGGPLTGVNLDGNRCRRV